MCLCEEQQGHQPKELICQRGQHLPALGSSLHTSRVRSWPPAAGVGLVGLSSRLGWWVLCTCAEHRAELSGRPGLCFTFCLPLYTSQCWLGDRVHFGGLFCACTHFIKDSVQKASYWELLCSTLRASPHSQHYVPLLCPSLPAVLLHFLPLVPSCLLSLSQRYSRKSPGTTLCKEHTQSIPPLPALR